MRLWMLLALVVLAGCVQSADEADSGTRAPSTTSASTNPPNGHGDPSATTTFISVQQGTFDGRRLLSWQDITNPGHRDNATRLIELARPHGSHEEEWPQQDAFAFLEALHRDWERIHGEGNESRSNPIAVRQGEDYLFAIGAVVP
jgi:hypothetical protein